MARWTLLAAALTFIACGGIGGNSAVCNNGFNAAFKISNEILACEGQPAISSAEISAATAACSLEVSGCSSQDNAALNSQLNCLNNQPPNQCAWLDAGVNPDAGLSQWQADEGKCTSNQTLSGSCNINFKPK
jgi:hypothetical protein